jgi:hypothetical protein
MDSLFQKHVDCLPQKGFEGLDFIGCDRDLFRPIVSDAPIGRIMPLTIAKRKSFPVRLTWLRAGTWLIHPRRRLT